VTVPANPSPDGYISFPITVDPSLLLTKALTDIQSQIPGFVPQEGHLETIVLEEAAAMMSVAAAIASQVPMSIFAAFGQLIGIMPNPGLAAIVTATVTTVDSQGYTIPAGLQVSFPVTGSTSILFTVLTPLVVPFGSTTGTITLICSTVGSFPNGLASGTHLQLVQTFFGITSIVTTEAVTGGQDPDTITSYINRLSEQLQLMAPRPILPNDFADMAQNVNGVFRACAIDGLNPGRIVNDGVTTNSSLVIGSVAAAFSTADIGRTVTDSLGDIPAGATIASVNPGAHTATLAPGFPATGSSTGNTFTFGDLTNQQRCVTVAAVDQTGQALTTPVTAALLAYLQGQREVNFLVFTIPPTFTSIDVSVTAIAQVGFNKPAVQAAIALAIQEFLSPAFYGGGQLQPPEWTNTPTLSLLALADQILNVPGVALIQMGQLAMCLHGGTPVSADLTMPGDAPLPTSGTLTVVVS
jgi:hypothetical protein